MAQTVKKIPDGYGTVTPHLTIGHCAEAVEFYKKAFGAEELFNHKSPDGRVMHAEVRIGNSILMMNDEFPEMGGVQKAPQTLNGTTCNFMIYTEDVDALFARAVKAGAQVAMPVADQFWGDRYGQLTDPFAHSWAIATHIADLTPEQLEKAAAAAFGGGA